MVGQISCWGPHLSAVVRGVASAGVYDEQDRVISYGDASYVHDEAGDLLSKTDTSGTTTYDIDAFGSLRSIATPAGETINYTVDGRDRRIARTQTSSTRAWLYRDQLEPVAEVTTSGALQARYVYATKQHVPDYAVIGGANYRIITDHLGSVRLVVNASTGTIAQRIEYDEFGNVLLDTSPGFQPFGFAGGLYDSTTGLVRFGAREYEPVTGRWVSRDPVLYAGRDTNLYAYAGSDPVNWIDIEGMSKTQGLRGDDPWYREFREAARRGKAAVDELTGRAKDAWRRGELTRERWEKIKGWAKTASDGRILRVPIIIFINPCITHPELDVCRANEPNQCIEGS